MSEKTPVLDDQPNEGLSRRDLFRTAGFAAGGAMLLNLPHFLSSLVNRADAAVQERNYSARTLHLELEGQQLVGKLRSISGGGIFTNIIASEQGPNMILSKRPGPVRYGDIVLEINLASIDKPLFNWIDDMLTKIPVPKNGAILYGDFSGNQTKRLEFSGALLSELGFPGADAESIDQALLTLRLTPQSTRLVGGKGPILAGKTAPPKPIMANNFRFNVQGLEKSCNRIRTVNAVAVRRMPSGQAPGTEPSSQQSKGPGLLEYSLISITLPEADAGPFHAWFDKTVIKGDATAERAGLLEWLDPTLKTTLAALQLGGLGIVRYEPDPVKSNEQQVGMVQVDMYCETINMKWLM
jgi:hypothetical protein